MITATNIHKHFGQLEVLRGVSLHIDKGEIVAIVGKSGAGKTTLLQILGSLDRPDAGQVQIGDTVLDHLSDRQLAAFRNRHIGFVFQLSQLLPEFTALENVMMPALIGGMAYRHAQQQAQLLLERMDIAERADHKPNQLSGGEQQRVAVARALMMSPDIILADEPTGSLDEANKAVMHQLLRDLRDRFGQTLVIVTHDKDLAAIADRVLTMKDGLIVENN